MYNTVIVILHKNASYASLRKMNPTLAHTPENEREIRQKKQILGTNPSSMVNTNNYHNQKHCSKFGISDND